VHGDDVSRFPRRPSRFTQCARALELLSAPSNDRELGVDEETGLPIFLKPVATALRPGRAMTDPKEKPKTASLLTTMSPRPHTR